MQSGEHVCQQIRLLFTEAVKQLPDKLGPFLVKVYNKAPAFLSQPYKGHPLIFRVASSVIAVHVSR